MSSFSSVAVRAVFAALLLLTFTHCTCSGETTKKMVGKVTQKTTETIKGAAAGVSTGIDEGRKQVSSSDGAIVIDRAEELEGKIEVEVVKHTQSEGQVAITVGFSNTTDVLYRITGLFESNTVLALDKDGFVSRARNHVSDITIPPRAKDMAVFRFEAKETPFVSLRAFGRDYPLPALAPPPPPPLEL
jgi:hypothetical protein